MKHIDFKSVTLIENQPQDTNFQVDWAGFPPFIRGNSALPTFPQIVFKNHFSCISENIYSFENQNFIKIIFQNDTKNLSETLNSISNFDGVLLDFSSTFNIHSVAFIRALRCVKVLQNNNFHIKIAIEINEKHLKYLPLILASAPEYLVCEEHISSYISENKDFIFSHSIDPFGGNAHLEEITHHFLDFFIHFYKK